MPNALSNQQLLSITKISKSVVGHIQLGVRLASASGLTVEQLLEKACKDRFLFAQETLRAAKRFQPKPQPHHRLTIARAYYAMYHAARAAIFFVECGDDYEAHTELPKHIPDDFPDKAAWENKLKTARLERNRADYDPYPKADSAFSVAAASTLQDAKDFMIVVKAYLRREGCLL